MSSGVFKVSGSSRKCRGTHAGARGTGVENVHADIAVFKLGGPDPGQRLDGRLGDRIGAPERARIGGGTTGHQNGASGLRPPQERLQRADQPPVGVDVHVKNLVPHLGVVMGQGRHHAECTRIADENVQPLEPFEKRRTQRVDGFEIGQIARDERRFTAGSLDFVIDLFQSAHGARKQDHMGTLGGEACGNGAPDPTRGPCDEGHTARHGL